MKKIFAILLTLSAFAMSADARTIGRSPSFSKPTSYGTVRSTPTPRPVVPSYQSAPRQYTPSYTPRPAAPAPVYQPQQQQRSGPGWGHVGAFAAGAATGALVDHAINSNNHPVYQQQPQVVYQQQPVQPVQQYDQSQVQQPIPVAQPQYVSAPVQQSSGGMGFFGFLFWLALIGGVGYAIYYFFRKNQMKQDDSIGANLPFAPVGKFFEIQNAYSMGEKEVLRAELGPNLIDEMMNTLPTVEDQKKPVLSGVSYTVQEHTDKFIAILYRYTDVTDSAYREEVWNFVAVINGWKLDGIEQLV
ncbi:MAG TPA: hypothetical protein VFM18_13790 [Methanosarcina sp.]|nr:hypothetical protein [Methanosarcina sp.]